MVLRAISDSRVLVFCTNKALAEELQQVVNMEGFRSDVVLGKRAGGRSETNFDKLDRFNRGETRLLTTTDLIGTSGIDIPSYTHMLMFDMPDMETYRRRTEGRSGHCLTYFEYDPCW